MRLWIWVLATGCLPEDGALLDLLGDLDPVQQEARLGERPVREHAVVELGADLPYAESAYGYRIESSDPAVIRVARLDEISDRVEPNEFDGFAEEQALWMGEGDSEESAGSMFLQLRSGTAGTATLSLVHPDDNEVLDAVEVTVGEVASAALIPMGATRWSTMQGMPNRSVEGGVTYYGVELRDGKGVAMAGAVEPLIVLGGEVCPTGVEGCDELLYPVGEHTVTIDGATASFEVVAVEDVVDVEFRQAVSAEGVGELLLVGVDRNGELVGGLPGGWTGSSDEGDLYLYAEHAGAGPTEVEASWNGLSAEAEVFEAKPGKVRNSYDTSNCSAVGFAPAWLGVLGGLLALRRRKR